jgi:hypothetical protein
VHLFLSLTSRQTPKTACYIVYKKIFCQESVYALHRYETLDDIKNQKTGGGAKLPLPSDFRLYDALDLMFFSN